MSGAARAPSRPRRAAHRIGTLDFEIAVADPASPIGSPEALTASLKAELVTAVATAIARADAEGLSARIAALDVDLGAIGDALDGTPDWPTARARLTASLLAQIRGQAAPSGGRAARAPVEAPPSPRDPRQATQTSPGVAGTRPAQVLAALASLARTDAGPADGVSPPRPPGADRAEAETLARITRAVLTATGATATEARRVLNRWLAGGSLDDAALARHGAALTARDGPAAPAGADRSVSASGRAHDDPGAATDGPDRSPQRSDVQRSKADGTPSPRSPGAASGSAERSRGRANPDIARDAATPPPAAADGGARTAAVPQRDGARRPTLPGGMSAEGATSQGSAAPPGRAANRTIAALVDALTASPAARDGMLAALRAQDLRDILRAALGPSLADPDAQAAALVGEAEGTATPEAALRTLVADMLAGRPVGEMAKDHEARADADGVRAAFELVAAALDDTVTPTGKLAAITSAQRARVGAAPTPTTLRSAVLVVVQAAARDVVGGGGAVAGAAIRKVQTEAPAASMALAALNRARDAVARSAAQGASANRTTLAPDARPGDPTLASPETVAGDPDRDPSAPGLGAERAGGNAPDHPPLPARHTDAADAPASAIAGAAPRDPADAPEDGALPSARAPAGPDRGAVETSGTPAAATPFSPDAAGGTKRATAEDARRALSPGEPDGAVAADTPGGTAAADPVPPVADGRADRAAVDGTAHAARRDRDGPAHAIDPDGGSTSPAAGQNGAASNSAPRPGQGAADGTDGSAHSPADRGRAAMRALLAAGGAPGAPALATLLDALTDAALAGVLRQAVGQAAEDDGTPIGGLLSGIADAPDPGAGYRALIADLLAGRPLDAVAASAVAAGPDAETDRDPAPGHTGAAPDGAGRGGRDRDPPAMRDAGNADGLSRPPHGSACESGADARGPGHDTAPGIPEAAGSGAEVAGTDRPDRATGRTPGRRASDSAERPTGPPDRTGAARASAGPGTTGTGTGTAGGDPAPGLRTNAGSDRAEDAAAPPPTGARENTPVDSGQAPGPDGTPDNAQVAAPATTPDAGAADEPDSAQPNPPPETGNSAVDAPAPEALAHLRVALRGALTRTARDTPEALADAVGTLPPGTLGDVLRGAIGPEAEAPSRPIGGVLAAIARMPDPAAGYRALLGDLIAGRPLDADAARNAARTGGGAAQTNRGAAQTYGGAAEWDGGATRAALDVFVAALPAPEDRQDEVAAAVREAQAELAHAPGADPAALAASLHRVIAALAPPGGHDAPDTTRRLRVTAARLRGTPSGSAARRAAHRLADTALRLAVPALDDADGAAHVAIATRAAGLVLFHPYLSRLFDRAGCLAPDRSIADLAHARALLDALSGGADPSATTDPLQTVLLGTPFLQPLPEAAILAEGDLAMIEDLSRALVAAWGALGTTTPEGLRDAFVRREGFLRRREDGASTMTVTDGPFDMLLDRLPFTIGTVRLPWMTAPLHVRWRSRDDG